MFVTALSTELHNGAFLNRYFYKAYDWVLKAVSFIFINSFLKKKNIPTELLALKN